MYLVITSLWLTTADPCVEHVNIQSNCETVREKQGETFQNKPTIPLTWSGHRVSIMGSAYIFNSFPFHKYFFNQQNKETAVT